MKATKPDLTKSKRATADLAPTAQRSAVMRAVKSKNSSAEMAARRLIHALGYRYRLHDPKLPGSPDLVFAGRRKTIFIHGCFWHGHACPRGARMPKTNRAYWRRKIEGNVARDARVTGQLRGRGWGVMHIWECELSDPARLAKRVQRFFA